MKVIFSPLAISGRGFLASLVFAQISFGFAPVLTRADSAKASFQSNASITAKLPDVQTVGTSSVGVPASGQMYFSAKIWNGNDQEYIKLANQYQVPGVTDPSAPVRSVLGYWVDLNPVGVQPAIPTPLNWFPVGYVDMTLGTDAKNIPPTTQIQPIGKPNAPKVDAATLYGSKLNDYLQTSGESFYGTNGKYRLYSGVQVCSQYDEASGTDPALGPKPMADAIEAERGVIDYYKWVDGNHAPSGYLTFPPPQSAIAAYVTPDPFPLAPPDNYLAKYANSMDAAPVNLECNWAVMGLFFAASPAALSIPAFRDGLVKTKTVNYAHYDSSNATDPLSLQLMYDNLSQQPQKDCHLVDKIGATESYLDSVTGTPHLKWFESYPNPLTCAYLKAHLVNPVAPNPDVWKNYGDLFTNWKTAHHNLGVAQCATKFYVGVCASSFGLNPVACGLMLIWDNYQKTADQLDRQREKDFKDNGQMPLANTLLSASKIQSAQDQLDRNYYASSKDVPKARCFPAQPGEPYISNVFASSFIPIKPNQTGFWQANNPYPSTYPEPNFLLPGSIKGNSTYESYYVNRNDHTIFGMNPFLPGTTLRQAENSPVPHGPGVGLLSMGKNNGVSNGDYLASSVWLGLNVRTGVSRTPNSTYADWCNSSGKNPTMCTVPNSSVPPPGSPISDFCKQNPTDPQCTKGDRCVPGAPGQPWKTSDTNQICCVDPKTFAFTIGAACQQPACTAGALTTDSTPCCPQSGGGWTLGACAVTKTTCSLSKAVCQIDGLLFDVKNCQCIDAKDCPKNTSNGGCCCGGKGCCL